MIEWHLSVNEETAKTFLWIDVYQLNKILLFFNKEIVNIDESKVHEARHLRWGAFNVSILKDSHTSVHPMRWAQPNIRTIYLLRVVIIAVFVFIFNRNVRATQLSSQNTSVSKLTYYPQHVISSSHHQLITFHLHFLLLNSDRHNSFDFLSTFWFVFGCSFSQLIWFKSVFQWCAWVFFYFKHLK